MQDINEQLRMVLEDMYQRGMKDQEIADLLGSSQSHINHLRKGKRTFAKMRMETLLKLFPNLRISLDGSPITATNSAVNAGVNNGSMTIHAAGEADQIKSSLRSAILKSDGICDACKVKILTLLETV